MIFSKYLFDALTKEDIDAYRNNEISRFGRLNIQRAESFITKLSTNFKVKLRTNHDKVIQDLFINRHLAVESAQVQDLIENHFDCIKQYWGTIGTIGQHLESYNDLANYYKEDERFSQINEVMVKEFGTFMHQAIAFYIKKKLKKH